MLKMKSSRPTTLKGRANQIIKQIVKVVLPSDVVQLQAGRKKKPKKGGKKPKGVKAPRVPPSDGRLPKAPDGFLSHNIRPDYPSVFGQNAPRPLAQPTFQQPPPTTPFEKMFFEKLTEFKSKEIPSKVAAPSPVVPTPATPATTATPFVPSARLSTVMARADAARSRSRSLMRELGIRSEEPPSPAPSSSATRVPFSAPNRANQPSFDVTPEGKEEMKLRPQAPSSTFITPNKMPAPYTSSTAASSSSSSFIGGLEEEVKRISQEIQDLENSKPAPRARKVVREEWQNKMDRKQKELLQATAALARELEVPGDDSFAEVRNSESDVEDVFHEIED